MKQFFANSFVQTLLAFVVAFFIGLLIVSLFKEQIFEQFLRFAPRNAIFN